MNLAFPFFQYTSTCFFLQEEKDLCGSVHNLPTLGLNFGLKFYKPTWGHDTFCKQACIWESFWGQNV